ncbi:hypothetical protein L1049_010521 [Liquidambar formosana]|uniref:AAA+ ATPase domain-containing protein n=1 Tax=Liquidambar formosana TaxID=63359 RepID=A0AAP0N7Q0_LIQFO
MCRNRAMEVIGGFNAFTGIMSCLCAPHCLHGPCLQKMNYLKSPESQMEKLKRKVRELTARLNRINTKLETAKSQEGKEPKAEVSLWLMDVNNAEEELCRFQEEIGSETKCLSGCFPNCLSRLRLGKRIHKKLKVVDALLERGQLFSDDSLADLRPKKGTELPTVTIVGKTTAERNFQEIWQCLTDDETGIIGVYGMGGVGKTTIMKQIHNQLINEASNFDNVIWVTVSKETNLKNLRNSIARQVNINILEEIDELKRAGRILESLRQRKFVLILDDLWEVFPLEEIGIPSPNKDNGCKLVLTTRKREVCRRMETQRDVEVKVLTEEEAWGLFKDKVGTEVLLSSDIETIAKEVAKECDGLPLAIVVVGRALRNVNDVEEWKYALTELRNSCMRRNGMEDEVFARLEFSYRRLRDDTARACLLYCALYPEDHEIEIKELIEHWIWEGLMEHDVRRTQAYMLRGKNLVNELKDCCLLESFVNRNKGVECVKMHDLIRDMAIGITATDPRFFIKAGLQLTIPPSEEEWPEDVEWVSLMRNNLKCLSGQPKCYKLSTLFLQGNRLLNKFSDSFFLNMQNLKVLNLSDTDIEELPESLFFLPNLSALLLGNCTNLKKVPSLKNLSCLKVLDLSSTLKLKELPQGMDMLSNLRRLNISHTGVNCFPAESVHMFRHVEELLMGGIEWGSYAKVQNGRAYIEDLIKLKNLAILEVMFYNSEVLDRYTRSEHWDQLQGFNISIGWMESVVSTELGRKGIKVYGEHLLVRGSPALLPSNTSYLHVCRCPDITQLSMLNVSNLIECKIQECGVECIVSAGDQNNLSTLEKLELKWLSDLRMLCKGVVPPDTLRCLKILNVAECHSLKQLFSPGLLQHLRNLEVIKVQFCIGMEEITATEKGEEDEEEKEGIVEETNSCNDTTIIQLPRLRQLELYSLRNLRSIYKSVMVCDSLHTIRVVNCPNLKRLPLSIGNGQHPPAALKQIRGRQEWWRSLRWDHPDDVTFFHQFLDSTESDYKIEDLIDRLDTTSHVSLIQSLSPSLTSHNTLTLHHSPMAVHPQSGSASSSAVRRLPSVDIGPRFTLTASPPQYLTITESVSHAVTISRTSPSLIAVSRRRLSPSIAVVPLAVVPSVDLHQICRSTPDLAVVPLAVVPSGDLQQIYTRFVDLHQICLCLSYICKIWVANLH